MSIISVSTVFKSEGNAQLGDILQVDHPWQRLEQVSYLVANGNNENEATLDFDLHLVPEAQIGILQILGAGTIPIVIAGPGQTVGAFGPLKQVEGMVVQAIQSRINITKIGPSGGGIMVQVLADLVE